MSAEDAYIKVTPQQLELLQALTGANAPDLLEDLTPAHRIIRIIPAERIPSDPPYLQPCKIISSANPCAMCDYDAVEDGCNSPTGIACAPKKRPNGEGVIFKVIKDAPPPQKIPEDPPGFDVAWPSAGECTPCWFSQQSDSPCPRLSNDSGLVCQTTGRGSIIYIKPAE